MVSLPIKWAIKNNIRKGQEIEINEEKDKLVIGNEFQKKENLASLDISGLDVMTARVIHAYYKKGVDELRITYGNPAMIEVVQNSLGKESQGFEILDQARNSCTIKYVSGSIEEFGPLLRRTFLLLIEMAERIYEAIKSKDYGQLGIISHMEETNNRFTTICRRYINIRGHQEFEYVGPLYYIVEDLENIADQYKFICRFISRKSMEKKKISISKEIMDAFGEANRLLRFIYDAFYKFDMGQLVDIKKSRKHLVERMFGMFCKSKNDSENVLIHHTITIMQRVFCLVGPILVLRLKFDDDKQPGP